MLLEYHCIPRHHFPLGVFGLVEVGRGRWEVWGCPLQRSDWRPLVADTPVSYDAWTPNDSDGRFMGRIDLRIALQQSRSVVSSQLALLILCEKMHEWTREIFISWDLPLSGGVE